ncbi:hypothetical protein SAMN05444373_103226 [Thermoclostridium caenicola]|uniref:Two-component signal transduction system YycFG, regulatory protein YycH n=1 Tax=Thermoclostridium caenicola TaxID=659425 RepID=A0A1M6HHL6_9FIRM|nr:hypothetical protein SAMN05444373_103226 [Thermoclostridium caenicola]
MKRQRKERLKSGILIFLAFLCMVQIGILWNQTQGFPFNFLLEAIFADNGIDHVNVEQVKDNYFHPENITIMTDRFSQWVLNEQHFAYHVIWDDIRQNYLPILCQSKPRRIYPASMWSELMDISSIRIDFAVKYPNSMLLWFAGIKSASPSFNGIRGIIIVPQENVNITVNTLYVYDESSVYMYHAEIRDNMRPKAYYSGLANEMRNQSGIEPMSAIGEAFPDFADPAHEDIPIYAMDPDVTQSMQILSARIPGSLILDPESDDLESIQESILLTQKDSLLAMRDKTENIVVFSDLENVYQLNAYGVLEYKYLPPEQKTDPGDAKSSFVQALSFIELRKDLVGDAEIVLKDIRQEGNAFVFTFGYRYGGMDILLSDADNDMTAPAIRIKASSDRILECRWVIREFRGNPGYRTYSVSFIDMLDRINENHPSLLWFEKFRSIRMGYHLIITDISDKRLYPSWLIITDKASYRVPVGEMED